MATVGSVCYRNSRLKALISPTEEVVEWVSDAMREKHTKSVGNTALLATSIETQLGRIDRMLANLYDDKLSGEITIDRYEVKRTELQEQKTALELQLESIDHQSGRKLEKKLVLLKLTQRAGKIYLKCTPEQRRLIISKLFEEITYKGGIVSVKYTKFAQAIAENVSETYKILGGAK